MELHKLKTEELKGLDSAKLRETEKDIRRQLVDIRMDIYTAQNKHTGKIRGLRKALARVLTLAHASKKAAAPAVGAPKAKKEAVKKAKAPVAKAKPAAAAKAKKTPATKK